MDGVMNERTIKRVEQQTQSTMVVPTWPTMRRSLATIDAMVKANTRPGGGHHPAGAAHRADDARSSARRGFPL